MACSSARGLLAAAAVPAGVADELQLIAVEADLFEKLERLARVAQRGALAGDRVGGEQRERQNGIVVGERRLEPAPVRRSHSRDSAPISFATKAIERVAQLGAPGSAVEKLTRPRMACAVPRGPSSRACGKRALSISRASSRQPSSAGERAR